MWIKNKKTGLIWNIENKARIAKLLKDSNYVESRKITAKTKKED